MTPLGVKMADHRRYVRLEQTVAENEARQRGVDDHQTVRHREQRMTGDEEHRADDDGLAKPEHEIREQPAEERREVNEGLIPGADASRLRAGEIETLNRVAKVKRQHRVDGVEAEALPHLRAEQDVKPARMPLRGRTVHAASRAAGVRGRYKIFTARRQKPIVACT